MSELEAIRQSLPEAAKDIRLNLQSVLRPEKLTEAQVWGVALCSAYFIGQEDLLAATHADAKAALGEAADPVIEDAKAAAAIMGMNTIYYRTKHLLEDENYSRLSPRFRMQRMAHPTTDKATFELMSMACAALAGCGMCIQAHSKSIQDHGLSLEHVHDSVRIASVFHAVALAMGM